MDELRDVLLPVGKGTYPVKTPLEDDVLERLKGLINQAYEPIRGKGQEYLLALTCLKLAYTLDAVTMRLNELTERLEQGR